MIDQSVRLWRLPQAHILTKDLILPYTLFRRLLNCGVSLKDMYQTIHECHLITRNRYNTIEQVPCSFDRMDMDTPPIQPLRMPSCHHQQPPSSPIKQQQQVLATTSTTSTATRLAAVVSARAA